MTSAHRFLSTAFLIALAVLPASAQVMEFKEYAAELESAAFGSAPTRYGLIYVQRCDQCPTMGVTFNAQTQFFDNNRAITASAAEKLGDRGATLMFDPDTRFVTRVLYWPAN